MSKKVLIVDDNPAIRHAVRSCIEARSDWQVCGEAENGKVATEMVRRLHPRVVILDLSMPVMNGLEAAREIAAVIPRTEMVMFTSHTTGQLLRDAQKVGIKVVLSKEGDHVLDRLLEALAAATDDSIAA